MHAAVSPHFHNTGTARIAADSVRILSTSASAPCRSTKYNTRHAVRGQRAVGHNVFQQCAGTSNRCVCVNRRNSTGVK